MKSDAWLTPSLRKNAWTISNPADM